MDEARRRGGGGVMQRGRRGLAFGRLGLDFGVIGLEEVPKELPLLVLDRLLLPQPLVLNLHGMGHDIFEGLGDSGLVYRGSEHGRSPKLLHEGGLLELKLPEGLLGILGFPSLSLPPLGLIPGLPVHVGLESLVLVVVELRLILLVGRVDGLEGDDRGCLPLPLPLPLPLLVGGWGLLEGGAGDRRAPEIGEGADLALGLGGGGCGGGLLLEECEGRVESL